MVSLSATLSPATSTHFNWLLLCCCLLYLTVNKVFFILNQIHVFKAFEIPHKISYPYIERCLFQSQIKIQELLDLRARQSFWNAPWALIQFKMCHLTSIENPIVEIRRSYDRLISTMGFPILVRWHLYTESGPSSLSGRTSKSRPWDIELYSNNHRAADAPIKFKNNTMIATPKFVALIYHAIFW